ncbi:hypothetical protein VZT92_009993 [Zoarces viviparus]|uniref:Rab11 family-interacting protein 1 n=1 Tax=Zoarces viviparus TaxID=48416 RepID=A0AAW1FCN7_ZOAVI
MSLADQQWCPTSVQVTVQQARGLRAKGKSGTNDAYALMQVGKEKFQTSVVEKSVAPVWGEEAAFDLPPLLHQDGRGKERCTLHVHVLHRALVGPDKPLGQAVVNLLQLCEDQTRNKTEWFKLLDKTGKADKDRGEVLLDIQFMRHNMTASMFDLSATGKSRTRLGKFKDKVRGKKKDSDAASNVVPSFTQVLTDSDEEGDGEVAPGKGDKKKKHKMKSLFSHKSNLQKNMSQSMTVLTAKNSSLSGSQSSGLNVDSSEGKKKFKFLIHKRSNSSDGKDAASGNQKQGAAEQSNVCINGSHVYRDEPPPRASRTSSNFSLTSSGHGSMEDVPESFPSSVDSLRAVRQYSPWTEEEEEELENSKEDVGQLRREEEEKIREEEMRRKEEELERLADEKRRQEEEEERRTEEENVKREEEEKIKRVKREQEERERLAEQKRRLQEQRIEEERVRKEEEERVRKEEEERVRKEEEERVRKEEEERVRKEEEERVRKEEEERALQERVRKEEEERALQERVRKEEEERVLQERVRKEEEERVLQERVRKEGVLQERVRKEEEERVLQERRRKEDEMVRRQEEEREEKRRIEEQERMRQEEEEKIRMEERRRQEERVTRQEERKLAEEKTRMEEEERVEDERIRMEEEMAEEERRRRDEEEMRQKEKLEEQERRQREHEERIKEEEKARREKEEYERLVEEERKRIEAEEKIRCKEEERIRVEGERRKEEERIKRQEEECEQLAEEKRILEEQERKQREEEEMIRKEEKMRLKERARKEKEEYDRLVVEKMRQQEQEKRKIEEEEKMKREEKAERERKEEARKLANETLTREAEELKRDNKTKHKTGGKKPTVSVESPAEVISNNPFDENLSNNPFEEIPDSPAGPDSRTTKGPTVQQRVQSAAPSAGSKPVSSEKDPVGAQRERRPAPQPPGRNPAESQSQREQDGATQHLAQINKKSKDKAIKTVSVLPQRSVQMIAPLSRSPAETMNTQSLTQSCAAKETSNVTKHGKGTAPPRPRSVEEGPSSDQKTAPSSDDNIPHECSSEAKQASSVYGLNPFEDDENAAQDDSTTSGNTGLVQGPPVGSQAADKDAASQTKIKSTKAHAPQLPAKIAATSSTSINQNTEGGRVTGGTGVTVTGVTHACDPVRVQEAPLQESQPAPVQSAGEDAGGKKVGPPKTSRRLQPVKPLNPLEQQPVSVVQGVKDNSSAGVLCDVQVKTKVNDTGLKGPYSQLTQGELISLVLKQEKQLSERDKKISQLEQYIDNLLVRVIEEKPSILLSLNPLKKAA